MKELTIEQKAKAYDEAVENMRKFRDALNNHEELDLWVLKKEIVKDIEYYFPELKENEDEKIRKDIISYLRNEKIVKRYISDIEFDKWIAWLEKQGNNLVKNGYTKNKDYIRYADKYSHEIWRKLMDNFKNIKDYHIGCNDVSDIVLNAIIDTFNWLEKGGDKNKVSQHVEAINEEKVDDVNKVKPKDYSSIDPHFFKTTDKVEPKFKVGDWISGYYTNYKVLSLNNDGYVVEDVDGDKINILFENEKFYHLFTIADAKDGDVLAFYCEYKGNKMVQVGIIEKYVGKHGGCSNTFKIYVGVNWENNLIIGEYMGCPDIRPATKEQRDALMKAMIDAGYTFNFESKELKELSQSEVTKMSDQEEVVEIPFGAKNSELQEAIYYVPKGFHAEIDDDKVVIKKGKKFAAWSKEDEQITLSIEQVMNCASLLNIVPEKIDKIKTWLKSLKQRIGG